MIDRPTISPERMTALRTAMKRQQTETAKRGLPHRHIDAEALLILQAYLCKCGCDQPLDFESAWNPESPPAGYPVVAHEYFRRGKNSPGHVPGNTWWWRWGCNQREAASENVARGRSNRFAVKRRSGEPAETDSEDAIGLPSDDESSAVSPERRKRVSPLSKDHPNYKKPAWGKGAKA